MANHTQVKNYLAYWFQLGKQVVTHKNNATYKPRTIIEGNRFSPEFEACWHEITQALDQEHYLEGTDQTVEELLSPAWDIVNCARCDMLVPTAETPLQTLTCPCIDMPHWPNEELPKPRMPINSQQRLAQVNKRIVASLDAVSFNRSPEDKTKN